MQQGEEQLCHLVREFEEGIKNKQKHQWFGQAVRKRRQVMDGDAIVGRDAFQRLGTFFIIIILRVCM